MNSPVIFHDPSGLSEKIVESLDGFSAVSSDHGVNASVAAEKVAISVNINNVRIGLTVSADKKIKLNANYNGVGYDTTRGAYLEAGDGMKLKFGKSEFSVRVAGGIDFRKDDRGLDPTIYLKAEGKFISPIGTGVQGTVGQEFHVGRATRALGEAAVGVATEIVESVAESAKESAVNAIDRAIDNILNGNTGFRLNY